MQLVNISVSLEQGHKDIKTIKPFQSTKVKH